MNTINKIVAAGGVKMEMTKQAVLAKHRQKISGAFAFEYIIVLALMVVVITFVWQILGDAVRTKATSIGGFITGTNPGTQLIP